MKCWERPGLFERSTDAHAIDRKKSRVYEMCQDNRSLGLKSMEE